MSPAAITKATEMAGDTSALRFENANLRENHDWEPFDLVLAFDCYPPDEEQDQQFFHDLAARVREGGMLLVTGRLLENQLMLPRIIENTNLGYCFVDLIGGWQGEGRDFEASLALALVKGESAKVPLDFATIAEFMAQILQLTQMTLAPSQR